MFFQMKYLLFTILLITSNISIYSQEYDPYTYQDIEPKSSLNENIFYGGGFGLQLGTFILIKLTPEIGYRPTEKFEFGIGAYYMFTKNTFYNFSDHVYGGNVFGRLFIYQNIYIQGEYEILNVADFDYTTGYYTGGRIFIPGILGGIGYRQKIGERSAILTTILYNFTITNKTPYYNPIFRISLIF